MAKERKEKGFILVILVSLLLLLAVTAMSLNFKSGMQAKMAANRTVDAQTYFDQLAVIEQSLWKLTGDLSWRVPAGENYAYHGRTYSRRVFGPNTVTYPALAAYADTVIISVRAPNATGTVKKSFRYSIDTPFLIRKPRQVHIDSAGTIFFADYDNHAVWKIDAVTGAIVRVAGRGTSGSSGDGGPATEAELNTPRGVCTDAFGNVYIADSDNNRIRKVSAGFISTVVNTTGAAGDSGDGSPATAAQLRRPFGVRADAAGNLYIADTDNHRIRKVTKATGIITTIVNTTGQSNRSVHTLWVTAAPPQRQRSTAPASVFLDSALNIFIADTGQPPDQKSDGSHGDYHVPLSTPPVMKLISSTPGRRRRRHSGNAQQTIRGLAGCRRKHLHRRCGQPPDQKGDGGDRDHHYHRQHRRHRRLFRGRRRGHDRTDRLANGPLREKHGRGDHFRYQQLLPPAGEHHEYHFHAAHDGRSRAELP